jgi:dipeptidyl aminopeptidase/acylaminoacyl peptidase
MIRPYRAVWTPLAAALLAAGLAGCQTPIERAHVVETPPTANPSPAPAPPPSTAPAPAPAPPPPAAPQPAPAPPPPAPIPESPAAPPQPPSTGPATGAAAAGRLAAEPPHAKPAPPPPPPQPAPAPPPVPESPAAPPQPPSAGPASGAAGRLAAAGPTAHAAAAERRSPSHQHTIQQFLATTNLTGASFSPDGTKILVSGNQTGIYNAYAIPAAGGNPVPLTRSTTDNVYTSGYFPRDERILYLADQGGNELTHLYVRTPDGAVRDLTPGTQLKASFLDWAPDETGFFFLTNERDPRYFDLYEMAVDGYKRQLLFKNERGFTPIAVSPDRHYVALDKNNGSTHDSDVWLYDTTTAKLRNLTDHRQGEIVSTAQTFSPDGKALYYTTDRGRDFAYLERYDLGTGARETALQSEWDVTSARFARNGRYFIATINNDARTEMRLFATATMEPVRLPELPQGDISSIEISRDGRHMAFYADTSRSPSNLYVRDLQTGALAQLTHTLAPEIDPADLADGKVVRFRSYDGVVIPGILYSPQRASAASPVPAIVWVHGGPGDQSRLGYSALIQFLVNHGYVVYEINNRGSSGYGKVFFGLDDRKHGDADLDDCVASKRMLADLGYVRPDQIGILGGSYGGYMVLAALTFRPRAFAVGVDLFGVANWLRTLLSIPPWWEADRAQLYKELGDPKTDADYLRRISPLFFANQIERPLLVLQGENDPRVLKVESDEIVAAAKRRGVPVEYIVFPGEGHGFTKKADQERADQAVLDFLDRYLRTGNGR